MGPGTNKRLRRSAGDHHHHHQEDDLPSPGLYPSTTSSFSTTSASATATGNAYANANPSSSFRNVSACNRCRIRKNRCDQSLPACTSCEKAGVKCVGFDPITKREIPRTYVYYLESRVNYLEALLSTNQISFAPAQDFDLGSTPIADQSLGLSPPAERSIGGNHVYGPSRSHAGVGSGARSEWEQKQEESDKLNKLVSNIGMVSVQGASDPRYLGSTSGISFARVVFAAVKSSLPGDKTGRRSSNKLGSVGPAAAISGTSMRDSFFGLHSKPRFEPAPFPDRELGMRLVNLYFEHANPQLPILHRVEFMELFGRAYASKDRQKSAREYYMLNIVFAIGSGIILEDSSANRSANARGSTSPPPLKPDPSLLSLKKPKSSSIQRQPEEYHASAMKHLESFLGSVPVTDRPDNFGGGLEQLQAVLLLAGFALLRPVAPGLWYITGVAVRLGVDLGLHSEDSVAVDGGDTSNTNGMDAAAGEYVGAQGIDSKQRGRREWTRDLRRRLWWCVYSFDRLVSTCVGRPFGITDQVITTDWPSVLDDKDITPTGFLKPSHNFSGPSYKRVSHHYFRLRLLQSEILQVLQYRQAKKVHGEERARSNQFMHTKLSSSFLQPFGDSFTLWRKDIDRRLWEWKESAPLQEDTAVHFSVKFLELNYWQAVIMLYRQSLSVPPTLAGEVGPHTDVESPLTPNMDDHEDEDDIFLKVAEAGQRVLKLYHQLHQEHLVNYTYLATVHLFMAGIAFLYSIWHSPTVRSRLTLVDVNFTVLAATSVLGDLIEKCPPAEACRDAFERMSNGTVKMCQSAVGFGSQVKFANQMPDGSPLIPQFDHPIPLQSGYNNAGTSRPPPTFDYNLKDLFPEDIMQGKNLGDGLLTGRAWQPSSMQDRIPSQQYSSYSNPAATNTTTSSSSTPASPPYPQPSLHQSLHQNQQQQQQPYDPQLFPTAAPVAAYSSYTFPDPSSPFNFDLLMNPNPADPPTHPYTTTNNGLTISDPLPWDDNAQLPDLFGGFFFGGAGDGGFGGEGGGGFVGGLGLDLDMDMDMGGGAFGGGAGAGWGAGGGEAEGEGEEEEEEGEGEEGG